MERVRDQGGIRGQALYAVTLHPAKTKIAFCKGGRNWANHETVSFDVLGYTFRPRWIKTKKGKLGLYFLGAVSRKDEKRVRQEINSWPWPYWRHEEIEDIGRFCRSKLMGG